MILKAKTVLADRFWLVEKDGEKFATLRKNEEKRYILSNSDGVAIFKNKEHLLKEFGKDFFIPTAKGEKVVSSVNDVHGYSSSCKPFNQMYDVKRKLPLFTKSKDSKSLFCAGYYIIKFNKGWVKSFCPKFITLQRYEYKGPFKDELEMKTVLANANK
jgi:hypothetical protein